MTSIIAHCVHTPEDYLDVDDAFRKAPKGSIYVGVRVGTREEVVYLDRADALRIGQTLLDFAMHGKIDEETAP